MSIGGDELVQRFIGGPFGHLISWNPGQMSGHTFHGIISRAISEPNGLWFHICGENIEFTYQDYALISGLRFGSSNFDTSASYDPSGVPVYMLFCNGVHIRGDDLEAWSAFPWGAFTYKIITNYVSKTQDTLSYHFYGPAWILMIWGLEVVPSLGNIAGRLSRTGSYPRCLRWTFKTRPLCSQAFKSIDEIFEQQGVEIHNIYPDETELTLSYLRSLDCEHPLGVMYVPPTVLVTRGEQGSSDQVNIHRARRSTSRTEAQDVHDADVSDHRQQPRRRRDTGKRTRAPPTHVSSSSSEERHYTLTDRDRVILNEIDKKIHASETRILTKVKKWINDLADTFRCSGSRHIPPVVDTQRLSPPISDQNPAPLHKTSVQTTSPGYTPSEPATTAAANTTLGFAQFAGCHSTSELNISTQFVTTRDPQRYSTSSHGMYQGAETTASVFDWYQVLNENTRAALDTFTFPTPSNYSPSDVPPSIPDDLLARYMEFRGLSKTAKVKFAFSGFVVDGADFERIEDMTEPIDYWVIDIYMRKLSIRLANRDHVYPEMNDYNTIILGTDVMRNCTCLHEASNDNESR